MHHDDYKSQWEFERKGKGNLVQGKIPPNIEGSIKSLQNAVKDITATLDISLKLMSKSGEIDVNLVPQAPQQGQTIPDNELYKYSPLNHNPANGKYGWYVYNVIEHNLQLTDKNDYLLELIDLHKTDSDNDQEQDYELSHYGVTENKIIVWAIYKGGQTVDYFGQYLGAQADWDIPGVQLKTNLYFRWTVQRPITNINMEWI